jgi:hypothetical protein
MTMLAASAAMTCTPAFAAGTVLQYGSVKLTWNVSSTLQAQVHTNYNSSGANGGATAAVSTSTGGGSCTAAPGTQTDLNIGWGSITPSFSAWTGCNYENAIAVGVETNDSSGFSVYQYLDNTNGNNASVQLCAFANSTAGTFPMTAVAVASLKQTQYTTAPAAYTGTACATNGMLLAAGTGGTLQNSGAAPAQPAASGTYTGEYYQLTGPGSAGQEFATYGSAATAAYMFAGEDLQLNVASTAAAATNVSTVLTLQFVAN